MNLYIMVDLIFNSNAVGPLIFFFIKFLVCLIYFISFSGKQGTENYSKFREQQWYPNLEDYARAEGAAGAENNTVNNVTVQLGATAYLHCHVRSLGDRALAGAEVTTPACLLISADYVQSAM